MCEGSNVSVMVLEVLLGELTNADTQTGSEVEEKEEPEVKAGVSALAVDVDEAGQRSERAAFAEFEEPDGALCERVGDSGDISGMKSDFGLLR